MPLYAEIQFGSLGFLAFVAADRANLWREQSASSHVGLSHNLTRDTNV